MAKLVYYYGAMNSGKSIALMKDAYNIEEKAYTGYGGKEITTGNSGNLQPYLTCYIWQRIE